MKNSLLILPMTAILLFAGTVMADPDYAHKGKQSTAKMLKKLDLTEQQKLDIRTLRQQGKQNRQVFRQDIKEIEEQLQSVIRASEWDEQAAKNLLSQRQEIKSQLALTRATSRNAMWNYLSDEQQEKLPDRSEREHKKGEHRNAMHRFRTLDLTDDQRQEIATIIKQQKSDNSALIARKKEFKQQEAELIHSEKFDDEAWQQLNAQQREVDLSLGLAMAYGRNHIWNQLDKAQQAKMDKMAERRKEKMKKHAHDRM